LLEFDFKAIVKMELIDRVYTVIRDWLISSNTLPPDPKSPLVDALLHNKYALLGLCVVILSILLSICYKLLHRIKADVQQHILPDTSRPRFRKRDKVMFYGRKMLRKVRTSLQGKYLVSVHELLVCQPMF
jgi:hypothetical protein